MTEVTIKQSRAEITLKVEEMSLDELLPIFEQALRGAGYVFEGVLDFREED